MSAWDGHGRQSCLRIKWGNRWTKLPRKLAGSPAGSRTFLCPQLPSGCMWAPQELRQGSQLPVGISYQAHGSSTDSPSKVPPTRPKSHGGRGCQSPLWGAGVVQLKHNWLPSPSTRVFSCGKEASSQRKAVECEECAGTSSRAQDGGGLGSLGR